MANRHILYYNALLTKLIMYIFTLLFAGCATDGIDS